MSLLTLLEAANFLESAENCAAAVPRDGGGRAKSQSSTIIFPHLNLSPDKDVDSFGIVGSQCVNLDAQAARRSGGAGTREVHNKLEKYRRAQLKECFTNLRQYINVPENRKLSNLAILRLAIRHIKSLNDNYTRLNKILSKEKFEHVSLKNFLRHNLSLEIPGVVENTVSSNISSPSTDTASDDNDDADERDTKVQEPENAATELPSSSTFPAQLSGNSPVPSSSSIIFVCPAFPQKVTPVPGTIIIPPIISSNNVVLPFKTTATASSRTVASSMLLPELLPATHLAISHAEALVSLSSARGISTISTSSPVKEASQTLTGTNKNSGSKLMVQRTNLETVAGHSQMGNSRPVVQMLQQTITQRQQSLQAQQSQLVQQSQQAQQSQLVQQSHLVQQSQQAQQSQLVQQSQQISLNTVSEKGTAKKLAMLQPALTLPSAASCTTSTLCSSSSLLLTSPAVSTASALTSLQSKLPNFQTSTSSLLTTLGRPSAAPLAVQSSVPGVTIVPVATTIASSQHAVAMKSLQGSSLAGTSIQGTSLVSSGMFLQLMSQSQLGTLQGMRPSDDIPQPGGGQLVAIYPMVPSIPLAQFLTPVTVASLSIPTSTVEPGYGQRDLMALLPAASKPTKLNKDEELKSSSVKL